MTIGPEPMRRIDSRSSLRGKAGHPPFDRRPRVVRPRAGLGMELERARAELAKLEALDGAVVERHVRDLGRVARVDAEAVILRGHEHPAAGTLEHRVVRAAVAEREL